ncbi:glycosyl hydrolase family 61-domain-containing protein, partial [Macrophomina phaseolina]
LAASTVVEAHTIFTTLWVDGKSVGDGVGVRMRKTPKTASFPISLGDDAMACGYDGEEGNPRVVPVNDGATLSFEWRAYGSNPSKGAIDAGHKGPCAVYLKKVDSAVNDTGVGDGWFKVWDQGYDEKKGLWCNQMLGDQDENGVYNHKISIDLPKGLEGGYYLARPELLALHSAVANPPDPQFYTGCAQIFLQSTGNKHPQDTVSIPGYIKSTDASVTFNIYKEPLELPYLTPGPPVAALVSGGATAAEARQGTQQEGLQPDGCIMEMAGFCAYEVPSYTDETGCWASGEECWAQHKKCWDYSETIPTGGDPWCTLWGDKCQNIDDNCNAKNFNGPPNANKVLTPQ